MPFHKSAIDGEQFHSTIAGYGKPSTVAPIHITSEYDAPEYRLCAEDFKPHAGRIASLDIWFRDYEEIIPLVSGLASDIPSLTTFSLKNIRGLRAKLIHIQVPPLTHLRKLELHGVTIPWNSCIGNLESLSLIGIRRLSPSLSQLHTILQSSPQLRYLSLQHIQPSGRNDPRPPPVSLPHLNDFIIVSSGCIIHAILSLIVLSPTCRVQITSITTDGLTWLHPVTQNPIYDPEVTGFRLQQTSIRMLRSSAPPWSDEHTDSRIVLFAWASASHFLHQNYQSSLHCSRFTTLELDRTVLTNLPAAYLLANFLLELVNLETLRVAESDSLHVLTQALSKVSRPSSRPAEHDRLICPHLRKVSFGGRDLKSVWLVDETGSESIVALADVRRRASVPLTVIELKRLRIPGEIIDRLEALVDEVHVEECGAFHLPYR